MWFRVKGVPAFVTIGRDALWTELAELAAVAGAQIHIHLDHDVDDSPAARQRRLQTWANCASFLTFTATVSVLEAMLWDDLRGRDEARHVVKRHAEARLAAWWKWIRPSRPTSSPARARRAGGRHTPRFGVEPAPSLPHVQPQSADETLV